MPKACKPYRPQTKGKIERAVDYLKSTFLNDAFRIRMRN
ncbi:hypothetical protein H7J92_04575 [Sporosarcina aquimarina]|nr:hypothetical protein [Sporosarcina aquimarina]